MQLARLKQGNRIELPSVVSGQRVSAGPAGDDQSACLTRDPSFSRAPACRSMRCPSGGRSSMGVCRTSGKTSMRRPRTFLWEHFQTLWTADCRPARPGREVATQRFSAVRTWPSTCPCLRMLGNSRALLWRWPPCLPPSPACCKVKAVKSIIASGPCNPCSSKPKNVRVHVRPLVAVTVSRMSGRGVGSVCPRGKHQVGTSSVCMVSATQPKQLRHQCHAVALRVSCGSMRSLRNITKILTCFV